MLIKWESSIKLLTTLGSISLLPVSTGSQVAVKQDKISDKKVKESTWTG